MKKIVILFAVVLTVVSCSKTPEEKANALIKEKVQKTLIFPDSYDPAETIIDSAFYPFDSPEVYEKLMKAYELTQTYEKIKAKVKMAKASMPIWANPYSEFSRNEYNEQKENYENYLKQQEKIEELLEKIKKDVNKLAEKIEKEGKKFIGFKVTHSYRAKNNAGNVIIDNMYFLIDKDFKKVIKSYNSVDYNTYQMMLQAIKELYGN